MQRARCICTTDIPQIYLFASALRKNLLSFCCIIPGYTRQRHSAGRGSSIGTQRYLLPDLFCSSPSQYAHTLPTHTYIHEHTHTHIHAPCMHSVMTESGYRPVTVYYNSIIGYGSYIVPCTETMSASLSLSLTHSHSLYTHTLTYTDIHCQGSLLSNRLDVGVHDREWTDEHGYPSLRPLYRMGDDQLLFHFSIAPWTVRYTVGLLTMIP